MVEAEDVCGGGGIVTPDNFLSLSSQKRDAMLALLLLICLFTVTFFERDWSRVIETQEAERSNIISCFTTQCSVYKPKQRVKRSTWRKTPQRDSSTVEREWKTIERESNKRGEMGQLAYCLKAKCFYFSKHFVANSREGRSRKTKSAESELCVEGKKFEATRKMWLKDSKRKNVLQWNFDWKSKKVLKKTKIETLTSLKDHKKKDCNRKEIEKIKMLVRTFPHSKRWSLLSPIRTIAHAWSLTFFPTTNALDAVTKLRNSFSVSNSFVIQSAFPNVYRSFRNTTGLRICGMGQRKEIYSKHITPYWPETITQFYES